MISAPQKCGACKFTLNGKRCWSGNCHRARSLAFTEKQMAKAAKATGLGIEPNHYLVNAYTGGGDEYRAVGVEAFKQKAECLRLFVIPTWNADRDYIRPKGTSRIGVGCVGGSDCECSAEYRAAQQMTPAELAKLKEQNDQEERRAAAKAQIFDPGFEALFSLIEPLISEQVATIVTTCSFYWSHNDRSPAAVAAVAGAQVQRQRESRRQPARRTRRQARRISRRARELRVCYSITRDRRRGGAHSRINKKPCAGRRWKPAGAPC